MAIPGPPCSRTLERRLSLLDIHRALPDAWPFLLASTAPGGALGRYSLLLFQEGECFGLPAPVPGQPVRPDPSFFERLSTLAVTGRDDSPSDWPFAGGWFVYLGYEVVAGLEPRLELPAGTDPLPVAWLARCPAALVQDHELGTTTLVAETSALLERLWTDLAAIEPLPLLPKALPALELQVDPGQTFMHGVDRIRRWILEGDVFQVNLSRAWRGRAAEALDPAAVFSALAQANPSPFAGLARLPGGSVVSSSPERLVEVRNGRVQTRPIAGTRPRGHDDDSDATLSRELMTNPKERAEHIMLIDLERNDLGRVCRTGSVEVDELMVVESYAHVHHIVSNVRGLLRPEVDFGQLVRAVFPGGTITGCPKVRCMEVIAELEGEGRSFYTGSMGYIGLNGHLDLNILIRSLSVSGQELVFRTGAGIVADSDPAAELAETEAKARGLIRALGA
jgi:anthranilate synthase component 1